MKLYHTLTPVHRAGIVRRLRTQKQHDDKSVQEDDCFVYILYRLLYSTYVLVCQLEQHLAHNTLVAKARPPNTHKHGTSMCSSQTAAYLDDLLLAGRSLLQCLHN